LEEFVAEDGKAYMAMTTKWNSKLIMAVKSEAPALQIAVTMGKVLEHQIQGVRNSKPGLAKRMCKWDKGRKNDATTASTTTTTTTTTARRKMEKRLRE
jgi:hypothetical protein